MDESVEKSFIDRGRLERILKSMNALRKIVEVYVTVNNNTVSDFNQILSEFKNINSFDPSQKPPENFEQLIETIGQLVTPVIETFSKISNGDLKFSVDGTLQIEFLRKSLLLLVKHLFLFNSHCCSELENLKNKIWNRIKVRNLEKLHELFVFCDPELKTNVYLVQEAINDITSTHSCSSHYEVVYIVANTLNKVFLSNVYNQSIAQLDESLKIIRDNISPSIFVSSNRQILPIDLALNSNLDPGIKTVIKWTEWSEGYMGPNHYNVNFNQNDFTKFLKMSNYPLTCDKMKNNGVGFGRVGDKGIGRKKKRGKNKNNKKPRWKKNKSKGGADDDDDESDDGSEDDDDESDDEVDDMDEEEEMELEQKIENVVATVLSETESIFDKPAVFIEWAQRQIKKDVNETDMDVNDLTRLYGQIKNFRSKSVSSMAKNLFLGTYRDKMIRAETFREIFASEEPQIFFKMIYSVFSYYKENMKISTKDDNFYMFLLSKIVTAGLTSSPKVVIIDKEKTKFLLEMAKKFSVSLSKYGKNFKDSFQIFKTNFFERDDNLGNIYAQNRPQTDIPEWQKMADISSNMMNQIMDKMKLVNSISKETSDYNKARNAIIESINKFFEFQEKEVDYLLGVVGTSMPFYSKQLDKSTFIKDYSNLMQNLTVIDPKFIKMDTSFKTQRQIIENLPIFSFITTKIFELRNNINMNLDQVHQNLKKLSALEEIEFDTLKLSISAVLPVSGAKGGLYISNFIPSLFLDKAYYPVFTGTFTRFKNLQSRLNSSFFNKTKDSVLHTTISGVQIFPLDVFVVQSSPIAKYGTNSQFTGKLVSEFNNKMEQALEIFQMLYFELANKKKDLSEIKDILFRNAKNEDGRGFKYFSSQDRGLKLANATPSTSNNSTLGLPKSRKIYETAITKTNTTEADMDKWFYGISNFLVNKVVNPYVNLFFNMFDFVSTVNLADFFSKNNLTGTTANSQYLTNSLNNTSHSNFIYEKLNIMEISCSDCIFYLRNLALLTFFLPEIDIIGGTFDKPDTLEIKIISTEIFPLYERLGKMGNFINQCKLKTEIDITNPLEIKVTYKNIGTNDQDKKCKIDIKNEWFKQVQENTFKPIIDYVEINKQESVGFKITEPTVEFIKPFDKTDVTHRLLLLNAISGNTYPLVSLVDVTVSDDHCVCIKNIKFKFKEIVLTITK